MECVTAIQPPYFLIMTITLERKSNLMLMGRKFKIYIDNTLFDTISDGEKKDIELPDDSIALTIKVMNYSSKPLPLNSTLNESYLIRQSMTSTIVTSFMILFSALYLGSKFIFKNTEPILLYLAAPFFLVSIYYSTIGRSKVIQLEKLNTEN